MKPTYIVFLYIGIVTCIACSTDDHTFKSRPYASPETGEVTEIAENGSMLHGEFFGVGTSPIKDYGFVYDQQNEDIRIGISERVSLGTSIQTRFSGVADHALANGITCYYRAYAIVGDKNLTVYGNQKSFVPKGSLQPSITEIVPSSGKQGDIIVINGSGFSDKLYGAEVKFGNLPAYVTKTSSKSITCTVPFLPPGDTDVVIKININNALSTAKKFTVTN